MNCIARWPFSSPPVTAFLARLALAALGCVGVAAAAPFEPQIGCNIPINSPTSLPAATPGVAYSPIAFTADASHCSAGTLTWSAAGLPTGMSMSTGGVLSGTPGISTAGSYQVQVTVSSSGGSGGVTLSLAVNASNFSVSPLNVTFNYTTGGTVPASQGVSIGPDPRSFTVTLGSTCSWLQASSAGGTAPAQISLSVSPTGLGVNTYACSVTVSASATYTVAVTLNVAGMSVVSLGNVFTWPEKDAITGANITSLVTPSGGTPPYTWGFDAMPPGTWLAQNGDILGTPTAGSAGSYLPTAIGRDATGAKASTMFSFIVSPGIHITTPALANGSELSAYGTATLQATGGATPYTWSATGLPSGLTLSSAGALGGTPASGSQGGYSVQVTARDARGGTDAATLSLTIQSGLTITSPASLPTGTEQVAYGAVTFVASGGTGYSWSASGLPSGLQMSTAGSLNGTPAAGSRGNYTPLFTVTDASSHTATQRLPLAINAGVAAISVGPSSLPAGTVAAAYGPVTLTASGGTAPYTWTVSGGLPNGLTLSASGALSGTPAAGSGGVYTLAVAVRDANGVSGSGSWSLTVQSTLSISSPSSLAIATAGMAYGPVVFTAVGGTGSYTWSALGLPSGLSMSSAGVLSGTPAGSVPGTFPVQVSVRDTSNAWAYANLSLTVQASPRMAIVAPASLPACDELVVYPSRQFTASGGTAPYTWTATGVPAGLGLSAGGLLSGTPLVGSHGAYVVVATTHDSSGLSATVTLSLTVNAAPQIVTPTVLVAATAGSAYGPVAFTAAQGTAPYTWSLLGTVPSGIAMSAAGVLSGVPAAASTGSYLLVVQVSDSYGLTAQMQLTLAVQAGTQTLTVASPTSLAAASELVSYGPVSFLATGGSGSYLWNASGVPAGLTMSPAGVLSGTPSLGSSGAYNLWATVRDSYNNVANAVLVLNVSAAQAVPTVSSLTPASATAGGPAFTLTVNGAGFRPGAVVQWGGAALSTAFASAAQLTAQVPATSIGTASGVAVTVLNPGGGVSAAAPFSIVPAPPVTSAAGIVNAASSLPAIAPGALISIYGSNLALADAQAPSMPLPTVLSATSVSIGGTAIPLLFVSPGQINAQVPYETTVGAATLTVQSNGVSSAPAAIQVAAVGPGLLTVGTGNHVLAVNLADGSVNQASNPALPGQYVTAYLTGQGKVSNPVATGAAAPASPYSVPLAAVQVKIGGQPADIQFVGLAPYFVGLLQLNVLIPSVPAGETAFEVSIGGVAANATTISVGAR